MTFKNQTCLIGIVTAFFVVGCTQRPPNTINVTMLVQNGRPSLIKCREIPVIDLVIYRTTKSPDGRLYFIRLQAPKRYKDVTWEVIVDLLLNGHYELPGTRLDKNGNPIASSARLSPRTT